MGGEFETVWECANCGLFIISLISNDVHVMCNDSQKLTNLIQNLGIFTGILQKFTDCVLYIGRMVEESLLNVYCEYSPAQGGSLTAVLNILRIVRK